MKDILVSVLAVGLVLGGCRRFDGIPHAEDHDGVIVHVAPHVRNMRDLGGWRTQGGGRVRIGMIYRSAALNSSDDKWYCPNWQIPEVSRNYLTRNLGVRTDLDLRRRDELCGISSSPLGADVNWVNIPAMAYSNVMTAGGRAALAKTFRVFLDERNYPIVFHCYAGRDRAGTLAYLLNALLGVSDSDLERDWKFTWTGQGKVKDDTRSLDGLRTALNGYPGETLQERVASFFRKLGFSDGDIAKFRSIMLAPCQNGTAVARMEWVEARYRACE